MDTLIIALLLLFTVAALVLWLKVRPGAGSIPVAGQVGADGVDATDVIAQIDFHMAYGLYDQAESLALQALDAEPDRQDLKFKLFEVFFVWGKVDAFRQAGADYKDELSDSPEWQGVGVMASQLCPDDPTFH
ncbi:MAG: hypothetical protein AAF351_15410 [Pseudomonadota bacterium]